MSRKITYQINQVVEKCCHCLMLTGGEEEPYKCSMTGAELHDPEEDDIPESCTLEKVREDL